MTHWEIASRALPSREFSSERKQNPKVVRGVAHRWFDIGFLCGIGLALIASFTLTAYMAAQATSAKQSTDSGIPHLEKRGHATQLIVDDKPFLVLGGEVLNSSSSSVEYMKPIWPRLASMHLNTVLAPVAWETIEPTEGKFDFSCVDGLLKGARENNLKLIFLWFGAWKNTYSTYAPAWVKTNTDRFPRVQTSDGRDTDRLSPFSAAVRDADAKAFARLMQHLREVDRNNHTVLMIQVENEVGVIPESRDHSAVANAAFAAPVPASLMKFLKDHRTTLDPELRAAWEAAGAKDSGTWQEVFGKVPVTDDFFMAWQYAKYIGSVAAAGKAEYPIPMYVNAALIRPNYQPGQYNSGGPLPHSIDIWHAAAPSLDLLSPDIYFTDFAHWAGLYARPDNALFIPETRGGATGAANMLYAFGRLSAIGFSPFGIDSQRNAAFNLAGATNPPRHSDNDDLSDAYATLSKLAPTILKAQEDGNIDAALIEGPAQRFARISLGHYTASIFRSGPDTASRIGVMFIQTGEDEFLVVGAGEGQVTFTTDDPAKPIVGIESVDEEFFNNGAWTPERRLNGDETSEGQALRFHANDLSQGRIYKLRLYRYR